MFVKRIELRHFKRFRFAQISEFTADFTSPVSIITAINGSGKSSLLSELCPLPPVRSGYEQNGYKRLLIEHENKFYELITDFGNRTSPHKFIVDGVELNPSGATVIQEDLVAQHFGITVPIRNLIYAKVKLCNTTKAERKQLFLNINPLQLGLILDTHKKAQGRLKDAKATLQHLYSRKTDIEGKLLPEETLVQRKATKEKLTNEIMSIDKIIYGLEQHIANLKSTFAEDIAHRQYCREKQIPLLPVKEIVQTCKKLSLDSVKYTKVSRGNEFNSDFAKYSQRKAEVQQKQNDLSQLIRELSTEINEYQKHMESSSDRPPDKVEKELQEVELELSKFPQLPKWPIPQEDIPTYERNLNDAIQPLLIFFRDLEKPMIQPRIIKLIHDRAMKLDEITQRYNWEINQWNTQKESLVKELDQIKTSSSIPEDCTFSTCGLKNVISSKKKKLEEDIKVLDAQIAENIRRRDHIVKGANLLKRKIKPFIETDALGHYTRLMAWINQGYFAIEDWSTTLVDQLSKQPMMIYNKLQDLIEGSKFAQKRHVLEQHHQRLKTELEVLVKANATSAGFLQKKLEEKEKKVKEYLTNLESVDEELKELEKTCALYLEYNQAANRIETFQQMYNKGEQALLVTKAIDYWTHLLGYFVEGKKAISEDLRQLETLVRDQDILRSTYQNEIVSHIKKVEQNKLEYEKIEMALSPTTGMPYRSMKKYLNALIGNVNYFLSQMWSYKMRVIPLSEDDPLDYVFRIEIGNETNGDISMLSDGQTEAVNLAWVLTILLQLKLLDKIPLYADEIGRAMDSTHRNKMLNFLGTLIDNKLISQIFLINHFALFTDGFRDSNVICLSPESMGDLPMSYNEHVTMLRT